MNDCLLMCVSGRLNSHSPFVTLSDKIQSEMFDGGVRELRQATGYHGLVGYCFTIDWLSLILLNTIQLTN